MNIIIRILGVLGIICTIIGMQCKRHSSLMLFRTGNEMFFAMQYILLGGFTGAFLNGISIIRNFVFISKVKKEKSTFFWRFIFSGFFIVFTTFTWSGIPSLMFCVGKIATTFTFGSKNMAIVRMFTIATSFLWIIYNISVGAYEGIISDSLCIISTLIAIIRLDIIERKREEKL